jgi:hypothetical protein
MRQQRYVPEYEFNLASAGPAYLEIDRQALIQATTTIFS